MRSMQQKFAKAAAQAATAAGLDVADTVKGGPDKGLWWFQDGLTTRLAAEYHFEHACANFTLSGPAADHAAQAAIDDPGHAPASWAHAEPSDDGHAYRVHVDYADPGQVAAFFRLLAELLGPWRPARSFLAELGKIRAGLLDDREYEPSAKVGAAMAALTAAVPDRAAAGRHLDSAMALLPAGHSAAGQLEPLADALAATPQAL